MSADYHPTARIAAVHRVEAFACGKPPLDSWLRERALANEGRASRTYVVVAASGPQAGQVVAYYTLATGSVALADVRRRDRHNLPDPVPVMVLGRLAVDRRHGGQGLAGSMLREALSRTLEVAAIAGVRFLLVHAIDDEAARFYLRYGFHAFPPGGRTLFLPVETIAGSLGQRNE